MSPLEEVQLLILGSTMGLFGFLEATRHLLVDFSKIGRSLILRDYDPTSLHPIRIGLDV